MKLEPNVQVPSVRHAVVVGGGNTAIDATRELAKLGVKDVTLLYRRTVAEMPGYAHEMEHARAEGVRVIERAVPTRFVRDAKGDLFAVELSDGRVIQADLAVVAIGQARLRELVAKFPGVELDARGCVTVDEATGRTGNPRVFAGGDALGGELVVTAAQDAKRAARGICAALGVTVRPDSAMNAGRR
jgi:glutamate synthase (NADPH/NADH) small chain